MPTKKEVPNGSELGVPNRSELNVRNLNAANEVHWGADVPVGRPPVMDDDALDKLAAKLNHQLGRPPQLTELIEASGGCQRQRASRAIQSLRRNLATKSVRSQLILPQSLETELRGWVDHWMNVAAQQLADRHATLLVEQERQSIRQVDLIDEQQQVISQLRGELEDIKCASSEMMKKLAALNAEIQTARAERDIAVALAEDRLNTVMSLAPKS